MTLRAYIQSTGQSEAHIMNLLQNHGIISDLCVTVDEIDNIDEQRAINWLKRERGEML